MLLPERECLGAIRGLEHAVAAAGEDCAEWCVAPGLVLHEEDCPPRGSFAGSRCRRVAGASPSAGRTRTRRPLADQRFDVDPPAVLLGRFRRRWRGRVCSLADLLGREEGLEDAGDDPAGSPPCPTVAAHAPCHEPAGCWRPEWMRAQRPRWSSLGWILPPLGMASRAFTARFMTTCSAIPRVRVDDQGLYLSRIEVEVLADDLP